MPKSPTRLLPNRPAAPLPARRFALQSAQVGAKNPQRRQEIKAKRTLKPPRRRGAPALGMVPRQEERQPGKSAAPLCANLSNPSSPLGQAPNARIYPIAASSPTTKRPGQPPNPPGAYRRPRRGDPGPRTPAHRQPTTLHRRTPNPKHPREPPNPPKYTAAPPPPSTPQTPAAPVAVAQGLESRRKTRPPLPRPGPIHAAAPKQPHQLAGPQFLPFSSTITASNFLCCHQLAPWPLGSFGAVPASFSGVPGEAPHRLPRTLPQSPTWPPAG